MVTITYTIGKDKTEYTDIFSKSFPLNKIVESLQVKHGGDYNYIDIYVVSVKCS
jgi:uncharacterized protein involved in exopolysaccharide biosynthesis